MVSFRICVHCWEIIFGRFFSKKKNTTCGAWNFLKLKGLKMWLYMKFLKIVRRNGRRKKNNVLCDPPSDAMRKQSCPACTAWVGLLKIDVKKRERGCTALTLWRSNNSSLVHTSIASMAFVPPSILSDEVIYFLQNYLLSTSCSLHTFEARAHRCWNPFSKMR